MLQAEIKRLVRDVEKSMRVAEQILSLDIESFVRDVRNRYTLRLALVEIAEACIAIGLRVLRAIGVRNAESYSKVFRKMAERGIISLSVAEEMSKLVRLRNLIIHRYWEVDDVRIYREAKGGGMDVIKRFLSEVMIYVGRLEREGDDRGVGEAQDAQVRPRREEESPREAQADTERQT